MFLNVTVIAQNKQMWHKVLEFVCVTWFEVVYLKNNIYVYVDKDFFFFFFFFYKSVFSFGSWEISSEMFCSQVDKFGLIPVRGSFELFLIPGV